MSYKTFHSFRHVKTIPFGLKWILANLSTEASQYVYKIGLEIWFHSAETITNIYNTYKNKMSLNPLVTLKQPKQISVQTRWKREKERDGGREGRKEGREGGMKGAKFLVHIKRKNMLKGILNGQMCQIWCHYTGPTAPGLHKCYRCKSCWIILLI